MPGREPWADAFQSFNKSNFNGIIRASSPFKPSNFLQLNDPPNTKENQCWSLKIIFLSHSCTVNPRQASYLAENKWLNMCSENISDMNIGDPSLRCCTDLQFHFFHVLSLGWRSPGIKAFALPGLLDNFWYRLELCSRLKNHAYCKNKLAKL